MGLQDIFEGVRRDLLDDLSSLLDPRATKGGVTVVAVTTMTSPQTFAGAASFVTQSSEDDSGPIAGGAVFASRTDTAAATSESTAAPTIVAETTSSTVLPTITTPVTTAYSSPTGVTSALSNSQATAQAKSSSSNGGLSGGAKAGIAFGVLIPVVALLIGALILMRRKKQEKESGERIDNEKAGMAKPDALPQFPAPAPAPAPQVATQFDPRMSKLAGPAGASAGGLMGAGAAGGAAAARRSPSPQTAWERPGAERNANDPANPFGNHAETVQAQAVPAAQPRSSSPINIDASDFPLPGSVAPSEKAISFIAAPSSDNLSLAPSNPATASNLSLMAPSTPSAASSSTPVTAAAAAAAAGVAGAAAGAGAAAAIASKRNSPPPADNVYRVQLDFMPSMEDELGLRAGQLVRIMHEYDDGWALCMRMDRSQQGVAPRSCLSKNSVKPRQGPPPQGRPSGPGPRGPNSPQMRGPPVRPMTPQSGRNSPAPYAQPGRPMTPQGGRNSPAPYAQPGRPMTPQGGRNSPAPNRSRAQSNAGPAPYQAYAPQGRSMSPGPYGLPGMAPPSRPDAASRARSNSLSSMGNNPNMTLPPVKPLSPTNMSASPSVARKPVPGQAV